jgi:hypothetical protein
MAVVINPRGTSGAGKTELVRRILALYGWQRGAHDRTVGPEPIYRSGRSRPFAYRLPHPNGGRPLVVVGHYEVTSGGCDTIRAADGGLEEVVRRAGDYAASGHDVLIEGLRLSSESDRSRELAQLHRLHVVRLATPVEQCARNLVARRRSRRDSWPLLTEIVAREHRLVEEACEKLKPWASVEILEFEKALERIGDLLAVPSNGALGRRSTG